MLWGTENVLSLPGIEPHLANSYPVTVLTELSWPILFLPAYNACVRILWLQNLVLLILPHKSYMPLFFFVVYFMAPSVLRPYRIEWWDGELEFGSKLSWLEICTPLAFAWTD
jgi:hypothetical protein